jgi:small-conductance mechanosensitive channel
MDKIFEILSLDKATTVNHVIRIVITVVVAVVLAKLVSVIFRAVSRQRKVSGKAQGYIQLFRYFLIIAVYFVALTSIVSGDFKTTMTRVLASSGIVAVILGIACQEPIGNLCAGVFIVFSKPFQIGDVVRYIDKDITGTVEEITLRHTVIRTFENKRLIIPNGSINKSAIENSSYGDNRLCLMLDFAVTYESDLTLAMSIISDVILRHPAYCDVRTEEQISSGDPPVSVLIKSFDDSAVTLRARVWSESPALTVTMKHDVCLAVHNAFKESGVNFAYPHVQIVGS